LLTTGGVKIGPSLYFRNQFDGFRPKLRREIDKIVDRNALALIGRRLGRERLGWRVPLARHFTFLYRPFLDGPDGLTGLAIKYIQERPAW
jgi:hypothetical protein